jgi:hypothetical protein
LARSAPLRVRPNPGSEPWFVDVAGGDGEHGQDTIRIVSDQSISVERQEELDRNERAPLVAIGEWMVARDSVAVSRGKISVIRCSVRDPVSWPRQRRLQKCVVTRAGNTAMLRDLRFVNREHDRRIQPGPADHFASSCNAARRFFMMSRAAAICFSNSGL